MFEEILKMCEGKTVLVSQTIRSGKMTYYNGPLRSSPPPLGAYRWCVQEENVVIGFSSEDVKEVRIQSFTVSLSTGERINIILKAQSRK